MLLLLSVIVRDFDIAGFAIIPSKTDTMGGLDPPIQSPGQSPIFILSLSKGELVEG